MTHLSLFSGIGGLDLAAEWAGIKTVGQCEWAEYPTQVLERHWPDVPRWKDIRKLTGESFYERTGRRTVDIISGGFPCQPFSVAGKQRGKEDDRYLWPEMVRVIKELRPTWIVGENVAGIIRMALPDILSELEICGYRTRAFLVPACAVGARHRRYRVAIVAHAESKSESGLPGGKKTEESGLVGGGQDVADTNSPGLQTQRSQQQTARIARKSEILQYTNGSGREEQCTSRESDQQRFSGRRCDEGDGCNVPDPDNRSGNVRRHRKFSTTQETGRTGRDFRAGAKEHESGKRRPSESLLGGMADGLSAGMDRDFLIDHYWDIEPDIPRIASVVEHRADRLKCLGNAVVPQQFYPIFKAIAISEAEQEGVTSYEPGREKTGKEEKGEGTNLPNY